MDDEIERLLVSVRADTTGFASDVSAMKDQLATNLTGAATSAGRAIEGALTGATSSSGSGFQELGRVALSVLDEIAASALRTGIGSVTGSSGGLTSLASGLIGGLFGLPGRSTGGPVSPGAAYVVGERGPELFLPTASGRVQPAASPGGSGDVKVSINVNAPADAAPQALARSGRQVARAVRAALVQAQR